VVDHSKRILHVTRGFYGATNDQTITKYDDFLNALRKREIYENVTYEIIDDIGETKTVTGVYVICDGGYMKDSFLIDPYAFRSSRSVIYWSEWLESLRKDVECLFGILKSRFRILRNPVSFHTIEDLQNIMFCCCILHNLVLSADGIDTAWEDDVAWDTLEPDADLDGEEIVLPAPPVVVDVIPSVLNNAIPLVQDMPIICQISSICMRNYTRKKQILVNHFLHWYNRGLLCWPRNMGVVQRGLLPILNGSAAINRSRQLTY
jgi:hypothetical protein